MSKIGDFVYGMAKLAKAMRGNCLLQFYKIYRDYKESKEDAYYKSTGIEDIKGNKDWNEAKWVA